MQHLGQSGSKVNLKIHYFYLLHTAFLHYSSLPNSMDFLMVAAESQLTASPNSAKGKFDVLFPDGDARSDITKPLDGGL